MVQPAGFEPEWKRQLYYELWPRILSDICTGDVRRDGEELGERIKLKSECFHAKKSPFSLPRCELRKVGGLLGQLPPQSTQGARTWMEISRNFKWSFWSKRQKIKTFDRGSEGSCQRYWSHSSESIFTKLGELHMGPIYVKSDPCWLSKCFSQKIW